MFIFPLSPRRPRRRLARALLLPAVLALVLSACGAAREEEDLSAVAQTALDFMDAARNDAGADEGEGAAADLAALARSGWTWELASLDKTEDGAYLAAFTFTHIRRDALLAALAETMEQGLDERLAAAERTSDIFEDDDTCRAAVAEALLADALDSLDASALPTAADAVTLTLTPGEEGAWDIAPDAALSALREEGRADSAATREALEGLLSSLTYRPKAYAIPAGVTVAPPPDEAAFGETDDAAVIDALLATSAARRLFNGQDSVWDSGVERAENSRIYWYLDESILVLVWQEQRVPATITYCEIVIADGSQLRRKLADDRYGSPTLLPPTELAAAARAVAAVDADFYIGRNYGINIYEGEVFRANNGAVDSCFFTRAGDMLFARAGELTEEEDVIAFARDNDVSFAISFGPIMVEDGVNVTPQQYYVGEHLESYARCCIGQVDTRHYLLCAVNYWYSVSRTADLMVEKGVQRAYNVDGGQSSAIILHNRQLNPSVFQGERWQSDIIYFATAIPGGGQENNEE